MDLTGDSNGLQRRCSVETARTSDTSLFRFQTPGVEGEDEKLSSVDDEASVKPVQQYPDLFKQAPELAEALFGEWDPGEEEDQDSQDDYDPESIFGYSLDTGKCQEEVVASHEGFGWGRFASAGRPNKTPDPALAPRPSPPGDNWSNLFHKIVSLRCDSFPGGVVLPVSP